MCIRKLVGSVGLILVLLSSAFAQLTIKNSSNTVLMKVTSTGEVGINLGTVAPQATLDIGGDLRIGTVATEGNSGDISVLVLDGSIVKKRTLTADIWDGDQTGSGADGVVTGASFGGTSTKTLTLSRSEGLANVTATFTDRFEANTDQQDLYHVLGQGDDAGGRQAINLSHVSIGTTDNSYLLNVYDDTSPHPSLIHFHENSGDVGGYLSSSYPTQFLISGGMALTNTSSSTEWEAKTDKGVSVGSYEGNLYFTNDMELIAGEPFTPTRRMVLGGKGSLFFGDDLPIGAGAYHNRYPKVNIIDEYGSSQLRVGTSFVNNGAYLSSGYPHQFNLSGGAEILSGNWNARSTSASIIGSYNGEILFFNDTGLTTGMLFAPTQRMRLATNGDLHITGALHEGSSRELKTDIGDLSLADARSALYALNPVTYRYKEGDGDQHVGFIAEDVPELVATSSRTSMVAMDVVAVLTKVLQEQIQENRELKSRLDEMDQRLKALE
jgi:hypothetical protein